LEARLVLATHTWTGRSGIPLWSIPSNWLEQQSPAGDPAADLVFPQDALLKTQFDNIPGALSIHSLTFSGDGYLLSSPFGYSSLALQASSLVANSFVPVGEQSGYDEIDIDINLQPGSHYFTQASTESAADFLQIGGHISGPGSADLVENGSGFLVFARTNPASLPNDYQGNTYVNAGVLETQGIANPLSLSSAVSIAYGAVLYCQAPTAVGSLSGHGSVLGSPRFTTGFDNTSTTFSGGLGGEVRKVGTGTWTLSGVGDGVSVSAGSVIDNGVFRYLSVDTSTFFLPFTRGLLGGSGLAMQVNVDGGVLAPGGPGPGILHANFVYFSPNRFLFFNENPTYQVKLQGTYPGTGYDQLDAQGVNLGTTTQLSVSLGFPSAVGDIFVIVQAAGGVTGTFSGLPDNQVFAVGNALFRINYTGFFVILTHVAGGRGGSPDNPGPGAAAPGPFGAIGPTLSRTGKSAPLSRDAAVVYSAFTTPQDGHGFAGLRKHRDRSPMENEASNVFQSIEEFTTSTVGL
jgi:hypothetical protein